MWLRKTAIRIFLPLWWRTSSARTAKKLQEFSAIEADSAWQFLRALPAMKDLEDRVGLFNNALEEMHHAALFDRASRDYANLPVARPSLSREPIYQPALGLPRFLAYVYVGEDDVFQQFTAYRDAAGPGAARRAFEQAMADEEDHAELAMQMLETQFDSRKRIDQEVSRIRRHRAWQTWLRFSKSLGELSASVMLSTLYYVSGWLFGPIMRKRLNSAPPERDR